jgi:hypothetical protein
MWDEVKSLGSRRITSSLIKRPTMKGNGIEGKTPQRGKNPNGSGFKPKGNFIKKGAPFKVSQPRGI